MAIVCILCVPQWPYTCDAATEHRLKDGNCDTKIQNDEVYLFCDIEIYPQLTYIQPVPHMYGDYTDKRFFLILLNVQPCGHDIFSIRSLLATQLYCYIGTPLKGLHLCHQNTNEIFLSVFNYDLGPVSQIGDNFCDVDIWIILKSRRCGHRVHSMHSTLGRHLQSYIGTSLKGRDSGH